MGTHVLASFSKITRPALRHVLRRERLLLRLEDALAVHPIAWIAAPAGSGKTVLAETFAKRRGGPCLYFQIDGRDADPHSFFLYLRHAAARLAPRKRDTLPVLTPAYALSLDAYAREFFEQLGARLTPGTLMVLDDFQELPEEASLQRLLPGALASLPDSIRVVVASRAAPPAPFARLLTHGRIAALGEADLNLTDDETRALARLQRARPLDASGAAALRTRTGGWFAGTILLLAAGADVVSDPSAQSSAHEVLFDYFGAEIFDRASQGVQRFLQETALLPKVSVPAAILLTGETRSAEILSELVRRNYFTVRRAGRSPTYEYHPLFRAFLLARTRRGLSHERSSDLTRRAIEALLMEGAVDDAASLMIDAGDHASLARLAIEQAPALTRQGRVATLLAWLRILPAEVRHANPWLSYWYGVGRAEVDRSQARVHLERAYEQFKARDDATGQYVSWAAVVRTYLIVWDRFGPLDRWIAEFADLRRRHPEFPSLEVEAGVTRAITGCLMWRQPGHPEMGAWAERCIALLAAELAPEMKTELASAASFYLQWFTGDLAAHARILDETRSLTTAPGVPPVVTALWHLNEASHRSRLGDRDACYAAVEKGLRTIAMSALDAYGLSVAIQAVYGALGAGDLAGAKRHHESARAWLRDGDVMGLTLHELLRAWISLCAGEAVRAGSLARTWAERSEASGAAFGRAWAGHTLAHALISEGRHPEAIAELEASLAWSRENSSPVVEHHCALSIAYAHLMAGNEQVALEGLRAAMAFGREHAFVVHPWIGWRRDVMARLCAVALEHGIEQEHVQAQIRASRFAPPAGAPESWPYAIRIRTLGAFEVWRGAERLRTNGRAHGKPFELLQAIIALGGSDVLEDALAEALWPEAEGDAAHHALETTVYRLRKLVGAGAVIQRARRISLDTAVCWVDAVAFEKDAGRFAASLEKGAARVGPAPDALARDAARLANLYRGPFVAVNECGSTWAVAARRRLRGTIARILAALQRHGGAAVSAASLLSDHLTAVDPDAASAALQSPSQPSAPETRALLVAIR